MSKFTSGEFKLPETRVKAMYAPEMFAETPNQGGGEALRKIILFPDLISCLG